MTTLAEAYERRDKSRLEIGTLALEEIERRVKEDSDSGKSAPYRTALSETLEQLSFEFSKYHASQKSCRSYLSDSIRLSRFFVPDMVAELEQYHLTTSHMLACLKGGEWPDADHQETQDLLTWTVQNQASPQEIWEHRKKSEDQLSSEQKAWNKILKDIDDYQEISAKESGEHIAARRYACKMFATNIPEENNHD
jgi:hypothetical protein